MINDRLLTDRINILADLLHLKGLRKIELSDGDMKVSLEAGGGEKYDVTSPVKVEKTTSSELRSLEKEESGTHKVTSPAVGTVYLSGSVGQEPFVKCGSVVKKGQKLCVLESMKMFSDLNCDCDGILESVNVSNGQVVGLGDVLFCVKSGETR